MKTISITEAILALETIDSVYENLQPFSKYQVDCVKKILSESIEIARPLATGEEKKDQWLSKAQTMPFQPLVLKECFSGIKKIDPSKFLALKRLCS